MVVLVGPQTWVPLTWLVKKQSATSHSSTEAEIVALEAAIRMEGLPLLSLWDDVVSVIQPDYSPPDSGDGIDHRQLHIHRDYVTNILANVDFVPQTVQTPPQHHTM